MIRSRPRQHVGGNHLILDCRLSILDSPSSNNPVRSREHTWRNHYPDLLGGFQLITNLNFFGRPQQSQRLGAFKGLSTEVASRSEFL
jgi:hypothetical protein